MHRHNRLIHSVRHIALFIIVLVIAWFSGCKPKQICPAYQSAFYLDTKIADEAFSPFDKDSLPKIEETVRKTDVLLVLRLGKKKIDKRMAIIPMITIFPEQADSALAMADSLSGDSTMMDEQVEEELEADSTEMVPEKEPEMEEPEGPGDIIIDEPPKPVADKPKEVKKVDLKDPELSDPSLKAEFEESFEDEPKEEDLNEPPPPEPEPKKKVQKKGPKKAEPNPDKTEEPPAEDDKF